MHLKTLQLINLKNYETAFFEFNSKINCFLGKNSIGKTNILDAIYYLSFTKSFITPIDSYNIKINESMFMIQGSFLRKEKEEQIDCGFKKGQKKQFRRNKLAYKKYAEHIGLFPLVMISPLDSELITGGSELRRKLMDGVISQYNKNYLKALLQYSSALKQRNALLKQFAKEHTYREDLIIVWNEQLERYGRIIFLERQKFISDFLPVFNKYYQTLTNDTQEIKLSYQSQLFEDDLSAILQNNIAKDRALQYTSSGTHKDDLLFSLNNLPIKRIGSQGQQKTFLLALKLAQYQHIYKASETCPILLLDDIFDKLDMERVKNLIQIISQKEFGQIFITDTNEERLQKVLPQDENQIQIFNMNKYKP